jgi:hypothetical protein
MSTILTRGVTLSVVLLATVLAPPPLVAEQPDAADDFKYLPSDTNELVIIRMDQLNTGEALKKLCKEFPMLEKDFRQEYGVELSKVQRIVEGSSSLWTNGSVVRVIYLNNSIAPESIAKAKREPRFPGDKATTYKKEKINTLTVYVPETGEGEAFCFVNGKTLVMSETKVLKDVLARDKTRGLPRGLRAALKVSDPSATVTIAIGFIGFTGGCKWPLIRHEILTRTGFDIYQIKAKMLSVAVTAKVGREVSLRGIVVCEKGQSADAYRKFGEAIQAYIGKEMKKASLSKQLIAAADKVRFSANENVAEATLSVKDEVAIAAIKAVFLPQR